MKKFLLMLVAFVATMSAFAQAVQIYGSEFKSKKELMLVADAKDRGDVNITVAGDFSVYVSSKCNTSFKFAGKTVAAPEIASSSVIVKYDKNGNEQWAVTFDGDATITGMAAEEDGTLYAIGNMTEKVTVNATDAPQTFDAGNEAADYQYIAAFVAKMTSDGKIAAFKMISSKIDEAIASATGPDPWGEMEGEFPLYSSWDPIDVTPIQIQVSKDKVYVSATYTGDVKEIGWEGSYCDAWGSYLDNVAAGVFSLNKSDLGGAKNIANIQMTVEEPGVLPMAQYSPKALGFVVDGDVVYVGFFCQDQLTLTTADKSSAFSVDYGKQKFVLATIGSTTSVKEYESHKGEKDGGWYKTLMGLSQFKDNLIIGGEFYGELPFNKKITSGAYDADEDKYAYWGLPYVASLKKDDGTLNWSDCVDEGRVVSMLVNGYDLRFITDKSFFMYKASTGENTYRIKDVDDNGDADIALSASGWGGLDDQYFAFAFVDEKEVPVESIVAPAAKQAGQRVNLAGQPVDDSYKGIVIEDGKMFYAK